MTTIHKVRKWLAEKLYPVDIVLLTRTQISKVDREVRLDLTDMPKDEREALLAFAHSTFSNNFFAQIVEPLIFDEIDHIARYSPNHEDDVLARGTINGIEKVKEEFERLNNAFKESHQTEIFNKYDVV